MAGCCEDGNEPPVSVKCLNFLTSRGPISFSKKDPASRNFDIRHNFSYVPFSIMIVYALEQACS